MDLVKSVAAGAGAASPQEQIANLTSANEAMKKTIEMLKQKLAGLTSTAEKTKDKAEGAGKEAVDKAFDANEGTDAAVKKGEEGEAELEKKKEELEAEKESLIKEVDRLEKEVKAATAKKAEEVSNVTARLGSLGI